MRVCPNKRIKGPLCLVVGGEISAPLRLSGLTLRLNPTAQGLDAHRWAAVLSGPSSDSLISCIFFFFNSTIRFMRIHCSKISHELHPIQDYFKPRKKKNILEN